MSEAPREFNRTVAAALMVALIIGASAAAFLIFAPEPNKTGKLQVVVSFYPLYFFSSEIAGDKAEIHILIPDNIEPHSWEPTPSDLIEVSEAHVLVYNGMGFEPWIDDFLAAVDNPDLIRVDTSVGIPLIPSDDPDHAGSDPHFWLDPLTAKTQVQNILQAFIRADPSNSTYYTQNAEALMERLDQLDQDFVNGLANRTKNAIVTTHEGFNYMAKRYGFDAHAAVGISADQQPSPQDMARLTDLVNDLGLHYVYSEPVYLDAVMEIIATETGANVLVLDGVHGRAGVHAHMDYFEIMHADLENLKIGLEVVQ
jgi:zinc transport system substrate-binding protein